jgi:transcription initiation factor TFIIIB Brf1 subunit/transcription initiation factor TFIIB
MADSDKVGDTETVKAESLALVPLDKKHIAESAAVTGGILGFVLTGPVGAALFAAVANYVVKRDGDAGEALRGVGKTVIESYNFLYKLNANYGISTRVSESVNKLVESVDSDNEVFEKVKKAITNAASKVTELNDEFDLVGKGKKVLNAAATVSEATIEKTIELDAKVCMAF